MLLEVHSLSQKYPLMEAEEFAAFKQDLAVNGLKNAIWLFQGKVLDGRNRLRACLELGLEPVFTEFVGKEPEAAAFVDSQNLHRRHLSREWRQKRVLELRLAGASTRQIAEELKCSHMTIYRDLTSVVTDVTTEVTTPPSEPVETLSITESSPRTTPAVDAVPSIEPAIEDHTPVDSGESSQPVTTKVEPEPEPKSTPVPDPTPKPKRITGRDGKSYRVDQTNHSKPVQPPPVKTQWNDLANILSELAQKIETLVPTPEENERPWELISSLETTAASLLRQAQRLRRRHHL